MVALPNPVSRTLAPIPLTPTGRQILEKRYLQPGESPEQRFYTIARAMAEAETRFPQPAGVRRRMDDYVDAWTNRFYRLLSSLEFLPNSPTIRHAGRNGTLSGCFVVPITDSMEGILHARNQAAHIMKHGGGIGFDFSELRPANTPIASTHGTACGPVKVMLDYNMISDTFTQGGGAFREGAQMHILRIDHPDVQQFIHCKDAGGSVLRHANISVAVTDAFLAALDGESPFAEEFTDAYWSEVESAVALVVEEEVMLDEDGDADEVDLQDLAVYAFPLVHGGKTYRWVDARGLFQEIVNSAWRTGDPGLWFVDRANADNPVAHKTAIAATNPCVTGDQRVYTAAGLRTVQELYERQQPNVVVVNTPAGMTPATPLFCTGVQPVFRLETREGYTIRLTADHKVETQRGMVPACELTPQDCVQLLNRVGGFGLRGSRAIGELLGWFVGDGSFNRSNGTATLPFFGEKRALAARFAETVNTLVPAGVGSGRDRTGRTEYIVASHAVSGRDEERVTSQRLVGVLADFGITPDAKVLVPESVFQGTQAMQVGYLSALFSADGTVGGRADNGLTVRLTSASQLLLQQVQLLLLNHGIASRLFLNRREAMVRWLPDGKGGSKQYPTQASHELSISKGNLCRFATEIGFLLPAKQQKLEEGIASYQLAPRYESFMARVQALVPDGEEAVYDLTVPEGHKWTVQGISVSNCGEQALEPYGSCNLGSIDVSKFIVPEGYIGPDGDVYAVTMGYENGALQPLRMRTSTEAFPEIAWAGLRAAVTDAVRFLDNVVEVNQMPTQETAIANRNTRRIGLGVMGWADLLVKLKIPYDSEKALRLARQVMGAVREAADEASLALGQERGPYGWYPGSQHEAEGKPYRNSFRLTVAPTGTISLIAGCSSGIEPHFALTWQRRTEDGMVFTEAHPAYTEWTRQLATDAATPKPDYLRTAMDIAPEWHIRHQATFQEFVDNSISKTINLPNDATTNTVWECYRQAMQSGCKGITIYRDGCRELQVLTTDSAPAAEEAEVVNQPIAAGAASGLELRGNVVYLNGAQLGTIAGLNDQGQPVFTGVVPKDVWQRAQQHPVLTEIERWAAQALVPEELFAAPSAFPEAEVAIWQARYNEPGTSGKGPQRQRLPDERESLTHKFTIDGVDGYLHCGMYPSGQLGEVFIHVNKQGSTLNGLMDAFATALSIAFQYGVPLEAFTSKFKGTRFAPNGFTPNPEIRTASSILDYIARYLESKFRSDPAELPAPEPEIKANAVRSGNYCPECPGELYQAEGCEMCQSCGYSKCG